MGDLMRVSMSHSGKALKSKGFLGVVLPDGRKGYVRGYDLSDFALWAKSRCAVADNLISTAKMLIGTPYMWGGYSSKGLDCSGLTKTVFFLNGVMLYRNASQQAKEGIDITLDGFEPGKSEGELRPGDLVFFSSDGEGVTHVGIYIGNNNFVHASTSKTGVIISSLTSSYYTRVYYGAKRVAV